MKPKDEFILLGVIAILAIIVMVAIVSLKTYPCLGTGISIAASVVLINLIFVYFSKTKKKSQKKISDSRDSKERRTP